MAKNDHSRQVEFNPFQVMGFVTAGEIQIDAVGFKGPVYEMVTQFLEEALGVVGQKRKKPEYHQHSATANQQRLGG